MAEELPADVAELLAAHRPEVGGLAADLRRGLRGRFPELAERVYRGWHGLGYHHPEAGYVVALFPRADEVWLSFEHGAGLPDPLGLLRPRGRQVRAVPLRPGEPRDEDALADLVEAALTRRR